MSYNWSRRSNTEAMTLYFVLLILFEQNCQTIHANGNVPLVPQNTTATINQSASFACSMPPIRGDVQWLKNTGTDDNFIYAGGDINVPFKERFIVNISSRISNLTISSVKPEDAGKYICDDGLFDGKQSSAFLIVLEGNPTCKSNMRMDGYIGKNTCGIKPDVVELSCTMKYHGGISPDMAWKKTGESHTADGNTSIVTTGNSSVTYTLRMEVNEFMENSSYSCQTTQLIGNQLHCQSGFINVISIQNSERTVNKIVGDVVTWSANAYKNCTYSWQTLQSDGNVSELSSSGGSQTYHKLKFNNPGIYKIEEICIIRGVRCASPKIVVNVHVHEKKEYTEWLVVIICLLATMLILLVAGVLCKHLQRKKRGRLESTEDARTTNSPMREDAIGLLEQSGLSTINGGNAEQQAENMVIRNPPELIKTIKTKSAKDDNTPIYGMAILGDELFVATGWSSNIEVWTVNEPTYRHHFEIQGLVRPFDLVSCTRNQCLYIFDFKGKDVTAKEIIRTDTNGKIIRTWCIGNDVCQSLSVTKDGNVIFATFEEDVPHILEYNPEGELLRSIKVKPDIQLNRILHVIKVEDNQFLISHGSKKFDNPLHRVCVAKCERADDGEWVISCAKSSFGGLSGSSNTQLCVPMHVVVKRDGTILVADREKSRVVLLSYPDLTFIREQIPKMENACMLRKPFKMCLNNSNSLLFVIDNAKLPTEFVWGDGRILVFKV